jgi:serine/threonine protein kinase
MSIEHEGSIYHRLAMRRLADDPVLPQDLEAYAASLVRAVLRLHGAGILHCDIKPSNVVWNAASRGAYLVDFGHAQREASAEAYTGTHGYTDPRVARKQEPHSRRSDAYSVGKTILEVGDRAAGGKFSPLTSTACRVAEALSRGDDFGGDDSPCASRLTLDQALEELDRGSAPSPRTPSASIDPWGAAAPPAVLHPRAAARVPSPLLSRKDGAPVGLAALVSPDMCAAPTSA